ncbi:MAG: hypothetical protein ABFS35_22250 [Bacteroidota bacterium]
MKKIIITLIMMIAFSLAFFQVSYAEMAKEGSFSGINFYAGSHKIIPLDKEHFVLSFENFGVNVSDSEAGPFHGMSTHNVGVIYFENGVGTTRGYFTNTDKDGDKIIWELNEDSAHMAPNPTKGKGKIMEGTGKFKGIQGSMEYNRRTLRPAEKGTHQSISKFKGTYKIVQE